MMMMVMMMVMTNINYVYIHTVPLHWNYSQGNSNPVKIPSEGQIDLFKNQAYSIIEYNLKTSLVTTSHKKYKYKRSMNTIP